jgi:hypothetical protein
MSHRPDLIVPIRDRRQRRRVLTLKNFGRLFLGVAILFAGLTIQSDLRHPKTGSEYGRLFGKQVSSQTAIEPKKLDVVTAAPIEDQTAADPLLVAAAAREQYLHVESTTTAGVPQTGTNGVTGTDGTVIVRGGSAIDQRHPTLSGGIFRQ